MAEPEGPIDWPCQQARMLQPPPRLLAALYVLLRDHVAPGDLEQTCLLVSDHADGTIFTNPYLEGYARALCTYLLDRGE